MERGATLVDMWYWLAEARVRGVDCMVSRMESLDRCLGILTVVMARIY